MKIRVRNCNNCKWQNFSEEGFPLQETCKKIYEPKQDMCLIYCKNWQDFITSKK